MFAVGPILITWLWSLFYLTLTFIVFVIIVGNLKDD